MSKAKKTKSRGRPPKYVIDSKGREIVGLSYHKGVGQYYLTFSDPRVYLGIEKELAIEAFHRNKEFDKLPPKAQEEAIRRLEIHQKALELLDYDECIQEHLCRKARAELDRIFMNEAQYLLGVDPIIRKAMRNKPLRDAVYQTKYSVSAALYSRFAPEEIKNRVDYGSDNISEREKLYDFIGEMVFNVLLKGTVQDYLKETISPESINNAIKELIDERIRQEAEKLFRSEKESLIWEQLYDLIMASPVRAALKTGIKELAYLELCPSDVDWREWYNTKKYKVYPMPLPWWLGWKIYNASHPCPKPDDGTGMMRWEAEANAWRSTGIYLGIFRSIDEITIEEIRNAFCFDYSSMDSLEYQYNSDDWHKVKAEIKECRSPYRMSKLDRARALKTVSSHLFNLGYYQCTTLYNLLSKIE